MKLKVCLAASEITPFAKTGGLADVASGLGRALGRAGGGPMEARPERGPKTGPEHGPESGVDVRLFLPYYPRIAQGDWQVTPVDEREAPGLAGPSGDHAIELKLGERDFRFTLHKTRLPDSDVPVYLVSCPELFHGGELYGGDDEHLRFALFSRAVIETCQRMGWAPDVIHCNDWHTAPIPLLLKLNYGWDQLFRDTRTVLTIHNIGYQGVFPLEVTRDLGWEQNHELLYGSDVEAGIVNFLKTGILYADRVTTVSRTYAREIQADQGAGLEEILRARSESLFGIVNGVDYGDWDPANDPHLTHPFDAQDLSGKKKEKQALLERFDLEVDLDAPLMGIVSRMTGQKGFEVLPDALAVLLKRDGVRLAILGSGEEKYESYFQWLRDTFPTRVGVYFGYNEALAHQIEAGSDLFLMPSRYEPCGLNQMYSLRYGTVPIVRRTGGLADTVEPFDRATDEGTGFLFDDFSSEAFFQAVRAALTVYKDPPAWRRLMLRGMSRDFSWDARVHDYLSLYRSLVAPSLAR